MESEANAHMRSATKYLQTGCLKWAPDHDSAADEFAKAAIGFKVVKGLLLLN